MTEKQIRILSIVATAMSIIMYVSYVFQFSRWPPPSTVPCG